METKQTKKYLILLILNILESSSDEKNPLTQAGMTNIISSFNISCDRKTVGRNIKFLTELGYPIVKTKNGYYLKCKKFNLEEVDFIKSAILSYPNKTLEEKENILNKIFPLLNRISR